MTTMVDLDTVEEYLYQAAGLGAACVMEKAPNVIMPDVQIERGLEILLLEIREKIGQQD